MDLISCRNLLIYMKPEVQDQLFAMFHFALKPEGYLFLGKSETVGVHHDLFAPVSKKFRLYQSKETPRKVSVRLPLIPDTPVTRLSAEVPRTQPRRLEYAELVRELLLKQHLVTAVLIDRDSQVLYFYGPTQDFITQPEGAATRDLLSMVSDKLRLALRAVIHSVREEGKTGEAILECPPNEHRQLRVRAVRANKEETGLILVTLEYEALSHPPGQGFDSESWARQQLQDDLRITQLDLEASIEALEANNVELHLANEEVMSMNEELQSANEELETSKEELQSVNEELATVNSDLERSINQLRTANDDLLNLLASTDLPTLFLDSQLRIKRVIPASRTLLRLLPSDVGRPIGDFALKIEPRNLEKAARQAQASASAVETEVHTPEGHFYLQRILPYRTDDRIEGVVVTFIPIDALKQAEYEIRESEKRFRTLADTAPVFIWISGLGGRLEFVNRRFTGETGRGVESLLGDRWHDLVHPSDLAGYLAACATAEAGGKAYDHELRLRKANGAYSWMRFVGEPRFEQEKLAGFVGSSVDIQYHKDAEEQLRDADRRKDEFLAILGHELRNPLSPIRNAAEALRFVDYEDKRLIWARETITRQVDHMTHLVDDLLDIARLTRGILMLRKETVDMALVVHNALESTKALIEARHHHIAVSIKDEPLIVSGDPVRLTQIIENLLTNAAKFTDEGGQLSLSVHRDGNEAVVSVADNGIGIPRHMLPRIFELFMQEERAIRKSSSGLGIGLSLVSQLVSLHGGSITASSNGPGQGSEFVIRLPLVDIPARPTPEAAQISNSGKERLLVVDDNVDSADATAMLLAAYGYEVRTAYDYATAVREAASFVPQIALLDLSKPEPDGLRLAGEFQQMPETKDTILIALSGYGQPDDLERSKKAGFVHHLVKPADPQVIHKLIQSVLGMG
jgi:two-component system CheB/CheR fusion protein